MLIILMLILVSILIISGCKSNLIENEKKVLTIGIALWNSDSNYEENVDGFKEGLAEQGFVEGKNVKFITKNPESDLKTQRQIIESFVEAKVNLIYSQTTPGTLVAKNVTQTIPIVFSIVTYPVESGVIEALESSGNNLVGTRNFIQVQRQYNQFERVYPSTKTLAFVHRKDEPNSVNQYNQMKGLLAPKGIGVVDIAAVDLNDMRTQLEDSIENVDSLFLACDTLINVGGEDVVIEISKKHKKPNFACLKGSIVKGALLGNVADFYVIGKISGRQAALILDGVRPSSLLTESPAEDYLIVNTKTASEIGIDIPQDVLDDTEEIIK